MCSPESSINVEHQGVMSPSALSAVVHWWYVKFLNLKGKTHCAFAFSPLTVVQFSKTTSSEMKIRCSYNYIVTKIPRFNQRYLRYFLEKILLFCVSKSLSTFWQLIEYAITKSSTRSIPLEVHILCDNWFTFGSLH